MTQRLRSPSIIFDLDGVIIDSEPMHREIEREMLRDRGITLSPAEHRRFTGMAGYDMWKALKGRYHLSESVEALRMEKRKKVQGFLDSMDDSLLVPGALECIRRLHDCGYPLALASSSGRSYVDHIVERFRIRDSFIVLVTGWDVQRSKPAPDIFKLAADRLGVTPRNCLVIEDSQNGILAARAAGMKVIAYCEKSDKVQNVKGADCLVHDMNEITAEMICRLMS